MVMTNLVEKYREMKKRGEKVTALTAYDYPTARLLDESGIGIILVGDSLGMVVLGYEDTTCVTLDEMLHHTRAVARGVKSALVVGDMPIHTFATPAQAVATAKQFIDAGAQAVRSEERRVGKECRCQWAREQEIERRRGQGVESDEDRTQYHG